MEESGLLADFFAKSMSRVGHLTSRDTATNSQMVIISVISSPIQSPHINHDSVADTSQVQYQTMATRFGEEGNIVGRGILDLLTSH